MEELLFGNTHLGEIAFRTSDEGPFSLSLAVCSDNILINDECFSAVVLKSIRTSSLEA